MRALIEQPSYRNGEFLPKEVDIAEKLGVARNTVRHAISKLVNEGLLVRKKGVGTKVATGRIPTRLDSWWSFTKEMQAKGIEPQAGVFTDSEGKETFIPATDADGKQWTTQYIQDDGTKRFAKDSRKEGCFHALGGLDTLAKAPALVIGEGYATASSLRQTLGFATVAAFDSGNLFPVAKALHAKFPDKPIVIAGDDDQHLEATQGINPGRSKAEEAAKEVGGKVLLPIFAPGEQAVDPKGFSDFNDLATKSVLGRDGIERQVRSVVDDLIDRERARSVEPPQQVEKWERRPQRRAVKIG